MARMSFWRRAALAAVLGSVLVVVPERPARADDTCADSGARHIQCYRRGPLRHRYARAGRCAPVIDACACPSSGYAAFTYDRYDYRYRYDYRRRLYAAGTPWSVIRSRLYRGASPAYVSGGPRCWFYDRWPLATVGSSDGWVGT